MGAQSSGVYSRLNGSCDVLIEGRWVAHGSAESMAAVARLFGVDGKVACVTPNGRTDSHGAYVRFVDGETVCAFCNQPLSGVPSTVHKERLPRSFPVTDANLDAPDGAVVDGYERVGDRWEKV